MKRRFAAASVALAALALVGCSAISSGTVTAKHYAPAWVSTSLSCISFGKYGCRAYMPMTHYWPATYRLDLRSGDKTGWVDVDPSTYDQEKVGDWFGARG